MFSLKVLNLSHNCIKVLEMNSFASLHKLLTLDLSFNELISIENQALTGLSRLSDVHLLLKTNFTLNLEPKSLASLSNISNLILNLSTVREHECLFMHSLERYAQRRISHKYVFFKSVNVLADTRLALCELKLAFLQFNVHFNLKSDYDNELFYTVCHENLIMRVNSYANNYNKCVPRIFDTEEEPAFESENSLKQRFLSIVLDVYFWLTAFLLFLILVPMMAVIFKEITNL